MISPQRSEAIAALDALTDQLPERATQLAERLARVLNAQGTPGTIVNGRRWIDGADYCPTCLARRCNCPPLHQPPVVVVVNGGVCSLHGPDDEALCVWCQEPAGQCDRTGGRARCEGTHEYYADQLDRASAPTITTPIRTGGS